MTTMHGKTATQSHKGKAVRRALDTAVPPPTQEQINQVTLDTLDTLSYRLRHLVDCADMSKLKVKFGESRPLKPVYMDGGGDPVGFIQKGPKIISLVIEDFTEDGWIRGATEDRQ